MIKSKTRKTSNDEVSQKTSLAVVVKSKNNFVYLMVCTKHKEYNPIIVLYITVIHYYYILHVGLITVYTNLY